MTTCGTWMTACSCMHTALGTVTDDWTGTWTGTWTGCMTVLQVGTATIVVTGTLQLTVATQSWGAPYVVPPPHAPHAPIPPQTPHWANAGAANARSTVNASIADSIFLFIVLTTPP
jgi:hypothetical protein